MSLLQPPYAEGAEAWQSLAVFHATACFFTANDIVDMADPHSFDGQPPAIRFLERFDPIRSEDQVEIEWTLT